MKFEESKNGANLEEVPSIYNFLPVALLGEGTYGQVYLVEDINSGNKYAMKKLDKDQVVENGMMRYTQTERNILAQIDHPFIVKLYYAFQTSKYFFLI